MYPTNKMPARGNTNAQAERVQDLTGDRNNPKGRAVTVGMAATLGAVAIKAKRLTTTPTAADYNALVDDIATLAATLKAMGAEFTGV